MLIRLAAVTDAPAINAIYCHYVTGTAISFELEPPSDQIMAVRIADTLPHYPWLVACSGDDIHGFVYASRFRTRPAYQWAVETTAYIHAHYCRQGIGRTLYQTLLTVLQHQGYCSCYAGITLPNPASTALHRAMGFEAIGIYRGAGFKFGAWHDVEWWQKPLCSYEAPVAPPKTITEITALHSVLKLYETQV